MICLLSSALFFDNFTRQMEVIFSSFSGEFSKIISSTSYFGNVSQVMSDAS